MTAALAFVDTETTGLDADRHEIWEVGLILRDSEGVEVERCWQLPVDLGRADPMALTIGGFYNRRWKPVGEDEWDGRGWATKEGNGRTDGQQTSLDTFTAEFAQLTHGAHLVGAVISFDEERLRKLLRKNEACPGWHYHLVDVEALAAGFLMGLPDDDPRATEWGTSEPPWDSGALSSALGVDPDGFDKHTALGDARWAKAIYDAVMA